MRGAPFVLFVVAAASVARMVLQHGMGNMAVRDELDRAVVVAQLLLGQHVRMMAVYAAVYADDLLHDAGDRTDVVRHHDDRHARIQLVQRAVEFLLELVVHEIRGFEITARANSARCIWPPDTSPIGFRAVSAIPDDTSSSIAFSRSSRV